MKVAKKQKDIRKKIGEGKKYTIDQALQFVSECGFTKFDQTIDVAIRLGVDAKQGDQQVRGAVVLPHGLGKTIRVLALVKGAKVAEAQEAGADFVGSDDMIEKINGGWMDFDVVVATPDMMGTVSKVGKVLGPRGLMPNPKLGTVTFDVKQAIKDVKSGKAEFKTEKSGIVHTIVGKVSFGPQKLKDNLKSLLEGVQRLKPSAAKGIFYKSLAISSTMGPGIRIEPSEIGKLIGL
jgi:large subunit ribosomal protein L1